MTEFKSPEFLGYKFSRLTETEAGTVKIKIGYSRVVFVSEFPMTPWHS